MNRLQTTAYAFCFGLAVLLPADIATADTHGRTPLSEYSTSEIVAEYQRRLDTIGDETPFPLSRAKIREMINGGVSADEKQIMAEQLALWKTAMSPFAEAGETGPMAALGSVLLDGGFALIQPDTCKGLRFLHEASQTDRGHASLGLSEYFKFKSLTQDDPIAKRTSLYWAKEAAHRDPSLGTIFDIKTEGFSDHEMREFNLEWASWSPKTDPETQDEIEQICSRSP